MAIEKVISVVSSELKTGKSSNKQYLDVVDQDKVRFSCWDEGLWNSLGKNASAKIEFEQKGIFKNIIAVEPMKEAIGKIPPQPEHFEPQEIGLWWKEMGKRIGDGSLERDFPHSFRKIKTQYYKRMSKVTGINFWKEQEAE